MNDYVAHLFHEQRTADLRREAHAFRLAAQARRRRRGKNTAVSAVASTGSGRALRLLAVAGVAGVILLAAAVGIDTSALI